MNAQYSKKGCVFFINLIFMALGYTVIPPARPGPSCRHFWLEWQ